MVVLTDMKTFQCHIHSIVCAFLICDFFIYENVDKSAYRMHLKCNFSIETNTGIRHADSECAEAVIPSDIRNQLRFLSVASILRGRSPERSDETISISETAKSFGGTLAICGSQLYSRSMAQWLRGAPALALTRPMGALTQRSLPHNSKVC